MGELLITRVDANEAAMSADIQHGEDRGVSNLETFFDELARSTADVILQGGVVQERSTPSMNVDITALLGLCQSTEKLIQRPTTYGPLAVASNATGSLRIDTVEIRQLKEAYDSLPRKFRDPSTGVVTTVSTDTKYRYTIEAQVIQGTPGAGVAPNHTSGWVKIAEVRVDAGESTAIYNADIFGITAGKDGESNTSWTAETTATYRLQALSVLKTLFRLQHDEDGDHSDNFLKDHHVDWGTGADQVDSDVVPLGTDVTNTPTGGTASNLLAASFVRAALQELFDRLKDLSGVGNDAVKNRHIDFGLGATQTKAVDIPIADADSLLTGTDVETALQEIAGKQQTLDVSVDTQMLSNKRYIARDGCSVLTLPISPVVGDLIDILADHFTLVAQSQTGESIEYLKAFYTTKDAAVLPPNSAPSGYVQLLPGRSLRAVYKGVGLSRVEPGVKLADPATLPAGSGRGCSFSSDGTYLAVVHATTPFITIYKRSGDTFTKLSDPATLPSNTGAQRYSVHFSADGTYLAVAHDITPYITIYKRSGDTFTKLSDPATLPAGIVQGCSFSADGTYLAATHNTTPFITVYKRTTGTDTFVKLTDPVALPASTGYECSFSSNGNYLAVAHSTTPFITVYRRSGDTFTKLSDPATLPPNTCQGCAFSVDGAYLALSHQGTPYITIYKRSGDTFTKLADPGALPTSTATGCSFSSDGNYLAVTHAITPFITVYRRSGDTFTKLSDPATLPASTGYKCSFSSNGVYLAISHDVTPFITIYKNKEAVARQWMITKYESQYPAGSCDGTSGELQDAFK